MTCTPPTKITRHFYMHGLVSAPTRSNPTRPLFPGGCGQISPGQDTSISKAKKAIVDYKKAIGRPEDLAELMTYYCEQAAGFSNDVGLADEGYFDSLVRMFAQVLKLADGLPTAQEDAVLKRLDQVRRISHNFGYGVGDEMDELLEGYQLQD